jgi:cytochrome P450
MASLDTESTMANPLIPYLSFTAGVLSHLLFFHQGEKFLYPFRYIQFYILLFGILTVARSQYFNTPTSLAITSNLLLSAIYFAGLYASLLIFRIFFNPVNRIPGPFFTRISKFTHVLHNLDARSCENLLRWHEKYGKFVRIGPNDISVTDPDAVQVISGANSKCYKGTWYNQDLPLVSLHTSRDRAMHDRRRRAWAPAFSDRALRGYEARIKTYNDLLLDNVNKGLGKPINISDLFNQFSFDVMGDLAFGKSFDMLTTGETHWAIKLLGAGMDPMAFGFPAWFFRFVIAIPGAAGDYWKFIQFCSDQLMDRIKEQPAKQAAFEKGEKSKSAAAAEKDITHTLIEQFESMSEADKKVALPMLQGDSRLIIVAGSDTTATTLVHLFWYLAANKVIQDKLRKEVKSLVGNGPIEAQQLQDCEYLNGCINESLRLNPPVPSGVFRKTPKEGVMIGNTFVPGDTTIQMPQYVMSRGKDPPFSLHPSY